MKKGVTTTIVFFGGTGDLVKRKLVPAVAELVHNGTISKRSKVLGIARGDFNDESYKKLLIDSAENKGTKKYIQDLDIGFVRGSFREESSMMKLKERMNHCEVDGCNRMYYLSTGFKFFPEIVKGLKSAGLEKRQGGFTRIVFEKPFGKDFKSARELDKGISSVFDEGDVYRLDHYLAKEMVQNLGILTFGNAKLRKLLTNEHVEKVELIARENLGVGARLGYYHETGAVRDMIQSHLLQALSLLLMNKPNKWVAKEIQDEKLKSLSQVRIGKAEDQILGQYKSYSGEVKKADLKERKTDTYARLVFESNDERWKGVPLILETGKNLDKKEGRITIYFKDPKGKINMQIWPKSHVSVRGIDEAIGFCPDCQFSPNTPDDYALLLGEVIRGEKTLFVRSDEVLEAWKVIEGFEKIRDKIKFIEYKDKSEVIR